MGYGSRTIPVAAWMGGLVLLALGGCGPGKPHGAFRAEYRMQVNVGPTTHWGKGAAKFAELVAAKTGGRIVVKPYYGSQLLKGAQLNSSQMVASGAIDCALESTINTAPVIPEMTVFTLPFFVRTFARVDRLEQGKTGAELWSKMRAKGLEPLAWGENGFRQFTNSRRDVRTPKDMKGLKVRVVGSPIFIDVFRALGADPVNMNWGDAVTAFQQKVVDGQENPCGILLAVQIQNYQSHMTIWNYAIDPLIFYWNKKQFDAFPEDIQTAIRAAADEAGRYQKALARAGLDGTRSLDILKKEFDCVPDIPDPLDYLRKNGMAIVSLSKADEEAFVAALNDTMDTWIRKLGPDFVAGARRDMDETP